MQLVVAMLRMRATALVIRKNDFWQQPRLLWCLEKAQCCHCVGSQQGKTVFSSTFCTYHPSTPFLFLFFSTRSILSAIKKALLTLNWFGVLTVMLSPCADVIPVVMDTGEQAAWSATSAPEGWKMEGGTWGGTWGWKWVSRNSCCLQVRATGSEGKESRDIEVMVLHSHSTVQGRKAGCFLALNITTEEPLDS